MAVSIIKNCGRLSRVSLYADFKLNVAAETLGFPPQAKLWSNDQILAHFKEHGVAVEATPKPAAAQPVDIDLEPSEGDRAAGVNEADVVPEALAAHSSSIVDDDSRYVMCVRACIYIYACACVSSEAWC